MKIEEFENRYTPFIILIVLFAITYFTLTPFVSVDCWWHMRMAEQFLESGKPIIYDQFAIQTEQKILASYPNFLPGSLYLMFFNLFSIMGLNILRILIHIVFMGSLVFISRKSKICFFILFQILILNFSMSGRVILQPDLFNYLFFVWWIFLLEKISEESSIRPFILLIILELLWVNTHPLFFFYGIFVAQFYLLHKIVRNKYRGNGWWYLGAVSTIWLFNPLGWRALESLFTNMAHSDFRPASLRSFFNSLDSVHTYGYILIVILFLIWGYLGKFKFHLREIHSIIIAVLLVPTFLYIRSFPFLIIFLMILQSNNSIKDSIRLTNRFRLILIILVISSSLLTIIDRNHLISVKTTAFINRTFGLKMRQEYAPKGLRWDEIHPVEAIREVQLLNQLAPQGNCVTNHMSLASCGVWFCRDKPFNWYGHAAVFNQRAGDLREFLIHLPTDDHYYVKKYLQKYNIQTVILTNYSSRYFDNPNNFHHSLSPVYIDPYISIFAVKGNKSEIYQNKINTFYRSYFPGEFEKKRFSPKNQKLLYLYLWFSAEITGNDGTPYLKTARRILPSPIISSFMEKTKDILQHVRYQDPS